MRAQTLGWIKLLPWASCASRQDNPSLQDTNFANFIHFLLEFIPLALLSRYLAWHPAAERGCVSGAGARLPTCQPGQQPRGCGHKPQLSPLSSL